MTAGVPLYVAGGFGGCGHAVASALTGAQPPEFTLEYQREHTPRYDELLQSARVANCEPSYETMLRAITNAGVSGLQNGLDGMENARLFVTDEVDEVVALVLRGLRRITEPPPP